MGRQLLMQRLAVRSLHAFELDAHPQALACMAAVLGYAERSLGRPLLHLQAPRRESPSSQVELDSVARRTLELTQTVISSAKMQPASGIDKTSPRPAAVNCVNGCSPESRQRSAHGTTRGPALALRPKPGAG